ncbi:CDP-alcohol phosphatidyltransferase family protein [Methylomarinum vadi]|uniref:CDP-alcohol phosphatidyltransferase family protein n=1 Tax=Methylomarinum vadi TaxID=438855 RepID=UPI0004DFCC9E|nr:CDP-alcohol phosphatidyltransferase family protein [Methylomarinum vadi]
MPLHLSEIHPRLTLPNLLTGSRFLFAPCLLWLAWFGHGQAFLILLALTFFTDALDGLAARLTNQVTQFGAQLDSWADLITYLTVGFGTWWLWRDIVHREDIYVYVIIACFLIPLAYSYLKFGKSTSYHTWLAKLSAVSVAIAIYPLFLADISWPFRLTVFIYVITAIEQIAITTILSKPYSNVRSIFQLIQNHGKP